MKKYSANDNVKILGWDIGFGKTSGAIGSISQMFLTGEASRILLSVPSIVYKKWINELKGYKHFLKDEFAVNGASKLHRKDPTSFNGLLPYINIMPLYNATPDALKLIKNYSPEELLVLEKYGGKGGFMKSAERFVARLQDKILNMEENTADQFMEMLENVIPGWSAYPSLRDFKAGLSFIFEYVERKFVEESRNRQKLYIKEKNNLENKMTLLIIACAVTGYVLSRPVVRFFNI